LFAGITMLLEESTTRSETILSLKLRWWMNVGYYSTRFRCMFLLRSTMYADMVIRCCLKKIENEYWGLEYCITALLVGALASHENEMIAGFRSIKPDCFLLC